MSAEPVFDTGHAYRVQKWTSRVLAIVCAVEAFALLGVGGAMMSLFPLKEVQPMLLIGGSKDDQVWRVEPFEVGTRGWELIAQKMAENYVVKREAIDLQTETTRWQEVAWLSSDDVFREFKEWMSGTNPNSPFEVAKKKRLIGADTSMTVVGEASGSVYTFYLRAVGVDAQEVPDVTVNVLAVKPPKVMEAQGTADAPAPAVDVPAAVQLASAAARSAKKPAGDGLEDPDYLSEIPFDPTKLRFDFTMSGDKSIAPERVFSDGIFTYFDYGDRWDGTDLPAFYRVVDGVDTPQNVRYKGSMVVVESAGAFTLRNGQRVVCVRPAGWEPEGEYVPPPDTSGPAPEPLPGSAQFK